MKFSITFAILLFFIFLTGCSSSRLLLDKDDIYSARTKNKARNEFYSATVKNSIEKNLSFPLNKSTEDKWEEAFWAMELVNYKSKVTDDAVAAAIIKFRHTSPSFRRAFLELVYTMYPKAYTEQIFNIAKDTDNSKIFAMCINYLIRADVNYNNEFFVNFIKRKFPFWDADPILISLEHSLSHPASEEFREMPHLEDLLKNSFGKDNIVIYSFQRHNRDYPGLTVIKDVDGKFLRNDDGTYFHISHLARAVTDLPGYLTDGNTPQGILSIQGSDVSKNAFIGPTPNLQLVLPFEANPNIFFHGSVTDTIWNMDLYKNILPESWKYYFPIYGTYYAGKTGRTEIISHGTTINPDYYKSKAFYPNTPSLGCITAEELWSKDSGKLIKSDQIALMEAYRKLHSSRGYFIIIELNDEQKPVKLHDIKKYLLSAER